MTQDERSRLAWMMLEVTFHAASLARNADRIAVMTSYPPAISLARYYGMEVIIETRQVSESASVDFGSREVMKRGASSALRLPIDLPLITTEDIETILDHQRQAPSVVIVPSRDGTGTNALSRRPPDLFPSHFGAGSFVKHLEEAQVSKADCTVIDMPRIALDIDDPDDIEELLKQVPNSRIFQVLEEMRISERLKERVQKG